MFKIPKTIVVTILLSVIVFSLTSDPKLWIAAYVLYFAGMFVGRFDQAQHEKEKQKTQG